jgi:hypothetical protein
VLGRFVGITLNGQAQETYAVLGAFNVIDARGSGAGWHVTVHADPFRQWDGAQYAAAGATLAGGSLTMSRPAVAAAATTISAAPFVFAGPYTIDTSEAVTIASAAEGTGMGTYGFGGTMLTLSIPAGSYAENYRSTVTVSVISGP